MKQARILITLVIEFQDHTLSRPQVSLVIESRELKTIKVE